MRSFEYGDGEIGSKEISVAVASMVLGAGIITLPRTIATETNGIDGWMSILLAGIVLGFFVYLAAKLASLFPNQTFFEYTSRIVGKVAASILTLIFGIYALLLTAYEIRVVGNIATLYLFPKTPMYVLTLVFLLVVIYAMFGSRVSLLRLNLMFFPIVLMVVVGVVLMNINVFDSAHLYPLFTTDLKGIVTGAKHTGYKMIGFEIVLFYVMLLNRPQVAAKASVRGIIYVIIFYLIIYIITIGVLGNEVTGQLIFPVIELAKQGHVPGEFFERFESVFFTVWLMAIFNTAAMSYDIALICFHSLFKKGKKVVYISLLSPIIYLTGMFPPTFQTFTQLARGVSVLGLCLAMGLPIVLWFIAKMRKVV